MFDWLKRNLRKVEVLGVGVEFHPPQKPDPSDPTASPFTGFTPWNPSSGVVSGAARNRVRLKRLSSTTDEDWDLLKELWFFLVREGEKSHTFGYKDAELPRRFLAPLTRWIHEAKAQAGTGSEIRNTPEGNVVVVNIAANTICLRD